MTVLSLLFIFGGGFFLIASQISEYAIGQRSLSDWIYQVPIAHRGLYNNTTIPENSISAFKEALARGYAIELDVHLSQDGEVVVFHDHEVERATGQVGTISETNYDQLKEYRLWQTEEAIPTLKQSLDFVQGHVPLFIELKQNGDVGILEEKVYQLLSGYQGPVIILSFNPRTLEWFRINAPDMLRGQNLSLENWQSLSYFELCQQALNHCKLSKPHVILYNARHLHPIVVKILSWFKPLVAYNVTSHEVAASLKNIVTNIMFDHFEPAH
jgi:glycerophosphoryl diester phosphodiesterase